MWLTSLPVHKYAVYVWPSVDILKYFHYVCVLLFIYFEYCLFPCYVYTVFADVFLTNWLSDWLIAIYMQSSVQHWNIPVNYNECAVV